jgi:hypothetical protein
VPLDLAVFGADDVGPQVRVRADEPARRVAGNLFDGVADEVDQPARTGAEHGARHLRNDRAEALLAPADVLEQVGDRDAHAFQLPAEPAQFVVRGQRERRIEFAARQAVGKAHQGAQRGQQAPPQQDQDQQQRHGQLDRQHQRVAQLLGAQRLLAAAVVHFDGDVADRLAVDHHLALGAQHVPAWRSGNAALHEIALGLGAHMHVHDGRVAHQRIDERAGRVHVHVPQRFLHAQCEDVGVTLQGVVQFAAGGLPFLYADQQVAAHDGRHRKAAEHHHEQCGVQGAAIQPGKAQRQRGQRDSGGEGHVNGARCRPACG